MRVACGRAPGVFGVWHVHLCGVCVWGVVVCGHVQL